MFAKKTILIAGLTFACLGFAVTVPVQAQTNYFGVAASAETLGYPGTDRVSVYLPNQTFAEALSDPPEAELTDIHGNSAKADIGTGSETILGRAHAWASSKTESVTGGEFNATSVYAHGYSHFYDRITVKSGVLPNNTPVTLVFDNIVALHKLTCSGLCDGYVDETLRIGAWQARSRWAYWYAKDPLPVHQPQIVVNTVVGAVLTIDSKLRVRAKNFFWMPGYGFGGEMKGDATARVVLSQAPEGVWIESISGTDYMPAQ